MHRILGLGALGLFLIAGSAPAQQPATSTGPVSTPVVQSGVVTTSDAPTTRRFGIFRGRRGYNRNSYVVQPVSQARVETAATQQSGVETIKAMPTEKTTVKTEGAKATPTETAMTSTPTTMVQQPTSTTSNRRFLRRDGGGLLSRLGSRFGR
jgi:hypothetical protein